MKTAVEENRQGEDRKKQMSVNVTPAQPKWLREVYSQTCICAYGGVALHRPSFHAGSRRTSGQRLGVFLSLPLADDGFATTPIPHGLLIGRPHLLVHLNGNNPWDQPNR